MENIEKIFPNAREIKDYAEAKVVHILLEKSRSFDIDEQNEIATQIEKKYKKYIFTGEIDLIFDKNGVKSYFLYYNKNKKRPR